MSITSGSRYIVACQNKSTESFAFFRQSIFIGLDFTFNFESEAKRFILLGRPRYTKRTVFGSGSVKLNFLVNYGRQWDLGGAIEDLSDERKVFVDKIHSSDISRLDLIIRWVPGGDSAGSCLSNPFMLVDCLWVIGEPISVFKEAVEKETGILTEVNTYDWITFLPMSDGGGAYNRYFGRLNTGKMKIRG